MTSYEIGTPEKTMELPDFKGRSQEFTGGVMLPAIKEFLTQPFPETVRPIPAAIAGPAEQKFPLKKGEPNVRLMINTQGQLIDIRTGRKEGNDRDGKTVRVKRWGQGYYC